MNTKRAFSLVELLISLLVISVILAVFAPIITKKLNANSKAINQSVTTTKNCNLHGFPDGNCALCYKVGSNVYKCLKCDKPCGEGAYKDVATCTCKSCDSAEAVSHCSICTEAKKCIKCKSGYGLKITSCELCEAGTYSDGSTGCLKCPDNNYCPGGSNKFSCPPNSYTESYATGEKGAEKESECKCSNGYYNYYSYYYPADNRYVNSVSCYLCPSGSYCNKTDGRKSCGVGQTSASGSTSKEACYCKSGFKENRDLSGKLTSCTACADGYYKRDFGGNNVDCYACSLPNCLKCSTILEGSATKCDECESGYFVNKSGTCSKIPDIWEPANFQVTYDITVVAAGEICSGIFCCWNLSNIGIQRTVCSKAAANKICELYGARLISKEQVNTINAMPSGNNEKNSLIANYFNEHQMCIYSAGNSYGVNCVYKLIISGCNGASDNSCRPTRFHLRDGKVGTGLTKENAPHISAAFWDASIDVARVFCTTEN